MDSTAEVGSWKPITTRDRRHITRATHTSCFQTNCNIYQEVAFEHRPVQKYREAKESLGPRELFCSEQKFSLKAEETFITWKSQLASCIQNHLYHFTVISRSGVHPALTKPTLYFQLLNKAAFSSGSDSWPSSSSLPTCKLSADLKVASTTWEKALSCLFFSAYY